MHFFSVFVTSADLPPTLPPVRNHVAYLLSEAVGRKFVCTGKFQTTPPLKNIEPGLWCNPLSVGEEPIGR